MWSHLCAQRIRSVFRYQVSPACKHIRPAPDYLYLPWELTPPPARCSGLHKQIDAVANHPPPDVLMAKLGLGSGQVEADGGPV